MPKYVWPFLSRRLLVTSFMGLIFCFQSFSQNLKLDCLRDPFVIKQETKNRLPEKSFLEEEPTINLLGIIKTSEKLGAILERNGCQEVVFMGDRVWGCIVHRIEKSFIVLLRDGKPIELFFN